MVYLDNAATTAMTPTVIEAMTAAMTDTFGNPSSIHAYGRKASQALRTSRQTIAHALKTEARRIIFTSGGTEANNTALKGYALANQDKGKHIITTAIEHPSVLEPLHYLQEKFGFEVTYLQPEKGAIRLSSLQKALRDDTILVSFMHANNETGDLLPVEEAAALLKTHQAAFHVDAVQTMGKLPVYPEEVGIDFLSATAHKFHGPKGVGFLYAKPLHFDSLLHGGEQEENRRASTENLVSIVGMAQALADSQLQLKENLTYIQGLRDTFLEALDPDSYYLNGSSKHLPHVINIGFPGQNNGILLTQLDLDGFAVSTGSACTAGTVDPSHVLASLYGHDSVRLQESIRISLSKQNTRAELLQLAKKLKEITGK
ncbi:cysteine desulfurase family protein [Streptococcus sp. H31]|uniref:cysteine desulfurase family protein n=1 Tax=Streptococcus huangxiaojuni TaxID=3237239 RepID=UPI0034A4E4CB